MGSHNKAATEVAAHSVKDTEVHGVGASPVCSETEADGKITDHADLPNVHHTPLIFTELVGGEAYTGGTEWTDWDLSSIIGAGAKVVHIGVRKTATTGQPGGLRKNGSAVSRYVIGSGAPECEGAFDVECDANRIIETRSPTSTSLYQFQVLGYWS